MNVDKRVVESIKECLKKNGQQSLVDELTRLIKNFSENNCPREDIINVIEAVTLNDSAENSEDES